MRNRGLKQYYKPNRHTSNAPIKSDYKYLSSTHRTVFKIDNLLGHKSVLIHFKRLQSYKLSFFFYHNGMELEIVSRRKPGKHTNMWS